MSVLLSANVRVDAGVPEFLSRESLILEVKSGSHAYGVSNEDSDTDVMGVCMPPKNVVFPESCGYIMGYDELPQFDSFVEHHVETSLYGQCDLTMYSVIKFLNMLEKGNPNVFEMLYIPEDCIIHITDEGRLLRDMRHMFISDRIVEKFSGFAKRSMLNAEEGQRYRLTVDYKALYHAIRLMLQLNQLIETGDMNLRAYSRVLSAIRKGEQSLPEIRWVYDMERHRLEENKTKIRIPTAEQIRKQTRPIVDQMLRQYYGLKT